MHKLSIPVLMMTVVVAGCNQPPPSIAPAKPQQVLVCLPVTKEIVDYEDFTGRTEAVASVEVRARATGYLEKILFTDGAMVKADEPLFEIDPLPYKAEFNKAEAELAQHQAVLNRMESEQRRAASLVAQRAMSRESYDKIVAERDESAAAVGVAKANLTMARLNLDYTTVEAPISGRASRRFVDKGNIVEANKTLLTSIVALDPMYISFDVDERTVLRLRRLTEEGRIATAEKSQVVIRFALADEDRYPHEGRVDFLENKVDVGTGTLRMRGVFNPKEYFSPGLFVRVRLFVGQPHPALLIPERAIGTDQEKKFVFVVDAKDEVVKRPVKTGALHDGRRVIETGLAKDERVVVNGLQRVRDGAKVEPKFTGEIKSKKNSPDHKNTFIEVLAPDEEKARWYHVVYDKEVGAPNPEVLAAVRAANVGDQVLFNWIDTDEGFAMTSFEVLRKGSGEKKH